MCCDSSPGTGQAPAPTDNKFSDTLANISSQQFDRAKSQYWPLEDQLTGDVQRFQTPDWKNAQIGKASADVASGFDKANATEQANEQSLGTNPTDGSHGFMQRGLSIARAGADAAATTGARERADTTAFDTLAGVSGRGDAKIGQSIGAAGQGGNLYMQSQRNNMGQEGMDNQGMGGLGGLIGTGLSMFRFSSPKAKTGVKSFGGGLKAIRDMPVNSWKYKPEAAAMAEGTPAAGSVTPGTHIGPMADDAAAATGSGDGQTLDMGDMLGTTMSAVKELDKKVSKIKGAKK